MFGLDFKFNEGFDFRRIGTEESELLALTLDIELRRTEKHFIVMYNNAGASMKCWKIFSDYNDANAMFNVMSQERYGYVMAERPDYEPRTMHEYNGFIRWYLEEDRRREVERDAEEWLFLGHGAWADMDKDTWA